MLTDPSNCLSSPVPQVAHRGWVTLSTLWVVQTLLCGSIQITYILHNFLHVEKQFNFFTDAPYQL